MIIYTRKNTAEVTLITYKDRTISAGYNDYLQYYDECKIVRILSGHGTWEINGKLYSFEKDDIFLFSRCDVRRLLQTDSTLTIEQVNFIPPAVQPHSHCADIFFVRNSRFSNKLQGAEAIVRDFDILRQYAADQNLPYRDDLIQNLVCRMVITAAGCCGGADAQNGQDDDTVADIMRYVSEHLSEPLTTQDAAKQFGFSPGHFARLFRLSAGLSFNEYVARCRVNAVICEIGETGGNILDAAFKYGFRSSSGFYKTFERVTGCRPKDFRKGTVE